MLHLSTPASVEADTTHLTTKVIASRLLTCLLLTNKTIGSEYRECYSKRTGIFIRTDMENIDTTNWGEEYLSLVGAAEASFLHAVIEDGRNSFLGLEMYWGLGGLIRYLTF